MGCKTKTSINWSTRRSIHKLWWWKCILQKETSKALFTFKWWFISEIFDLKLCSWRQSQWKTKWPILFNQKCCYWSFLRNCEHTYGIQRKAIGRICAIKTSQNLEAFWYTQQKIPLGRRSSIIFEIINWRCWN